MTQNLNQSYISTPSDPLAPPKKQKRNRTAYTAYQSTYLEDQFIADQNPDSGDLLKIASHVGLKKRVVQVWFQVSTLSRSFRFLRIQPKQGPDRDLNPGPLAPKARIIPLDHRAG